MLRRTRRRLLTSYARRMHLRQARAIAKELGQTFHQTAMRESSELMELGYELADSDLDDEVAASRLRDAFSQQKDRDRSVTYCLDWLARARESRTGDRAYRITRAAATGAPVEPVDPARVALWGRLREMGEMRIGKAYAELLRLVPELAGVVDAAERLPGPAVGGQREEQMAEMRRLNWRRRQTQRLASVVGPDAPHPDPLVKTLAMARLMVDYLHISAGDDSLGTIDTPHREIERARQKELSEREGYSVEAAPGGRYRVTATSKFGESRD
jgi:hypothetical protein